ncbi:MAG: type 3 dihydrofolate reductase [Pseudomonadota bacterium]
MRYAIVVAMDQNRVIGHNNTLPWHLSSDLQYFKKITMGKPIIMGRKTHESIGRPLPGRQNIILTRDTSYQSNGCTIVNSIEVLNRFCENHEELMITGGAEIYKMLLPKTNRIYLTEVKTSVEGETFFPEFDRESWNESSREDHLADEKNDFDYSFVVLDKV